MRPLGSVDILKKMTELKMQLQKVDIVGQAQQQGPRALRFNRTTRSLRRQLTLHRRKHALDLSALTVPSAWEASPHLRPHPSDLPVGLAALGREDPLRSNNSSDMPVVALAIDLGVGQDQPDGRPLVCRADQRPQGRTVVVRADRKSVV